MFQIDLTSDGNLQLHMPNRCAVEIPATVGGLEYIQKVLSDHHRKVRNQLGYIGTLPTQHAVDKAFADKFLADKRAKAAEEKAKEMETKLGVDLTQLRISI